MSDHPVPRPIPTCNLCGYPCATGPNEHRARQSLDLTLEGGYFDHFPADGQVWTFHFCELCVAWLVAHCRVYPAESGYLDEPRGVPGPPYEPVRRLLQDGDASAVGARVRIAYERAMERSALFLSESAEVARLARSGAMLAAAYEAERAQCLRECDAMHAMLSRLAAPSTGTPLERLAALAAGRPASRELALIRALHDALDARWLAELETGGQRLPQDMRAEARLLDTVRAYLDAYDPPPRMP